MEVVSLHPGGRPRGREPLFLERQVFPPLGRPKGRATFPKKSRFSPPLGGPGVEPLFLKRQGFPPLGRPRGGATFPKKAGFPLPGAAQGYGRAKMVGQSASLLSEIPPWSDKVAGRRARGQLALGRAVSTATQDQSCPTSKAATPTHATRLPASRPSPHYPRSDGPPHRP